MRLLLDECVPRPLLRDLALYDAHHVVDLGWSAKRNGELLTLMIGERFDALLTVDQSMPFQQNLRASGIGVVIIIARTNRVQELRPLIPKVRNALDTILPGDLVTISG
jgi:hypothetical protein